VCDPADKTSDMTIGLSAPTAPRARSVSTAPARGGSLPVSMRGHRPVQAPPCLQALIIERVRDTTVEA
jgi:hypothetical protein